MTTLVYLLNANAVGTTNWSKTPDAGVSYFEHKDIDCAPEQEIVLH